MRAYNAKSTAAIVPHNAGSSHRGSLPDGKSRRYHSKTCFSVGNRYPAISLMVRIEVLASGSASGSPRASCTRQVHSTSSSGRPRPTHPCSAVQGNRTWEIRRPCTQPCCRSPPQVSASLTPLRQWRQPLETTSWPSSRTALPFYGAHEFASKAQTSIISGERHPLPYLGKHDIWRQGLRGLGRHPSRQVDTRRRGCRRYEQESILHTLTWIR